MSDPVTNADIEDVLSSIRRLVSDSATPHTAPAQADDKREDAVSDDPGAEAPKAEKLVLTPAFRVHDTPEQDTGPATQILDEAASADEVMFLHRPIHPGQEDTPDLSTAQDDAPADEFLESDQPGDVSQDATVDAQSESDSGIGSEEGEGADAASYNPSEETDLSDGAEEEDGDIAADWPPASDLVEAARAHTVEELPLDHRVAELEAAVTNSAVEFEPDLGDAGEDIGPGIFLRKRADLNSAEPQEPTDVDEKSVSDLAPEGEAEIRPEASQAAVEAEGAQSWESFDAEIAAFIDDDKEIEGTAETIAPEGQDDSAILDATDDTDVLDEEMLRELVIRLVREELQGAVGEKITRNVRRLVRREVERALTLKSLE